METENMARDADRRTPRASGRKNRPSVDPAEPVIPPTIERSRHAEHGIEVAEPERTERGGGRAYTDAHGRASRPWRVVDTLAAMERAGTIDGEQRAAGERFRALFEVAGLAGLGAAPLERAPGGGTGDGGIQRRVDAGRAVSRALQLLGGRGALVLVTVDVLGLGQSLSEWDRARHQRNGRAGMMLRDALEILATEWRA
jgi:hypothetical protein